MFRFALIAMVVLCLPLISCSGASCQDATVDTPPVKEQPVVADAALPSDDHLSKNQPYDCEHSGECDPLVKNCPEAAGKASCVRPRPPGGPQYLGLCKIECEPKNEKFLILHFDGAGAVINRECFDMEWQDAEGC